MTSMRDDQLRLLQGDEPDEVSDRRRRRARRAGRRPGSRAGSRAGTVPPGWTLDPVTRERGLAGVRRAKLVLEAVRPPDHPLKRAS